MIHLPKPGSTISTYGDIESLLNDAPTYSVANLRASADHCKSVVDRLRSALNRAVSDHPPPVGVQLHPFVFGSIGRQDGDPEVSDIDPLLILTGAEVRRTKTSYGRRVLTNLITNNADLRFPHRQRIIMRKFNFAGSPAYPILDDSHWFSSNSELSIARRMQCLFEAQPLTRGARDLQHSLVEHYIDPVGNLDIDRLSIELELFYDSFHREHRLPPGRKNMTYRAIIKTLLFREAVLCVGLTCLAHKLLLVDTPSVLETSSAPLLLRPFTWITCEEVLGDLRASWTANSPFDTLLPESADEVGPADLARLLVSWKRGFDSATQRPDQFQTLADAFVHTYFFLALMTIVASNGVLTTLHNPKFKKQLSKTTTKVSQLFQRHRPIEEAVKKAEIAAYFMHVRCTYLSKVLQFLIDHGWGEHHPWSQAVQTIRLAAKSSYLTKRFWT